MDAFHRRAGPSRRAFGPFVLDHDRAELKRDDKLVPLRPKTYALLSHLTENAGRVVSKRELLDVVWPGLVVTDDSLSQAVSELRSALDDRSAALIRTLPRRGYLFDVEVRSLTPATPVEVAESTPSPVPPSSETVRAPQHLQYVLRSRGARGLAAVVAVVAAIALVLFWSARQREPAVPLDRALAGERSLVVLPFVDLSDPPAPHLTYAIESGLATDLGRHADVRVIVHAALGGASSSAVVDPRRAGREVGARHVLQGSVQRVDKAVMVDVRLIRTESGELLWSNRYEYSSLTDLTERREISARVANALEAKVGATAVTHAVRRTSDASAIDHWMQGRFIVDRVKTRAELEKARQHFAAALAAEPESVEALSGLAFTHICEVLNRWSADRKASLASAAELARRALALDPNHQSALKALASAQMFDGDLEGAMSTARRQLEINPSDAHSNRDLAATLYFYGRWEEALRQLEVAERLNPLDPQHLEKIHGMASTALIALGRYDEALARARRLQAVAPNNTQVHVYRAAASAHRGDLDAARQAAAELLRRRPDYVIGAGSAQRGSTAPAFRAGLQHLNDGLVLAGLPLPAPR